MESEFRVFGSELMVTSNYLKIEYKTRMLAWIHEPMYCRKKRCKNDEAICASRKNRMDSVTYAIDKWEDDATMPVIRVLSFRNLADKYADQNLITPENDSMVQSLSSSATRHTTRYTCVTSTEAEREVNFSFGSKFSHPLKNNVNPFLNTNIFS